MKTASSRPADRTTLEGRGGLAILFLILLIVLVRSILLAYSKPFWYDEVITVLICHLPSASAIWGALDRAADTMPPFFYAVERLARQLIPDDHIAYRLPAMLGALTAIACVYFILSKRVSRLAALVGAAFLLCTPLATYYAAEARPYGLLVGFISVAIVAWQRIDDSRFYAIGVAVSLAAASAVHYYAILVWPAFLVAEMSILILRRHFRAFAWASIIVGLLPLALFWRILEHVRQYYGQHFWAQPTMKLAFTSHGWLFVAGSHWGWTFAAGVTVVLLATWTGTEARGDSPGIGNRLLTGIPVEEVALALMLLWLPVIAIVAAKVGHGGMSERYMLPAVLGGALALGYVIEIAPAPGRVLLLVLFLMNYASSSVSLVTNVLHHSLLGDRISAAHEVDTIAMRTNEPALPIVISDELEFLPIPYYVPADSRGGVYAVTDPGKAAAFSGAKTDSGSLNLRMLRQYFPLQVTDYASFISTHREFLLVSDGDTDDEWLPACLLHDGYTLKLISPASQEQPDAIFEVIVQR